MKWQVTLYGIIWDDGKGEYDVEDLPENLQIDVDFAESKSDAIERALEIASDEYESLIEGTEQIVAKLSP